MTKLQIVDGSLQISNNGNIILVAPKNSCAIDVLSLYDAIPLAVIYNKYLGTSTNIFTQPLANCEDSTNTPFTVNSFIAFAEANLGFDTVGGGCGGSSPFEYNANATGIQPILGTNDASGNNSFIGGGGGNSASNFYSTIGGGNQNVASGINSMIGGGSGNNAFGQSSIIGGGNSHYALGNFSTIGGGKANYVDGIHSTIGGGYENKIIGNLYDSTIGGGRGNCVCSRGSVIAGGASYGSTNNIISAYSNFSSILGGSYNTASAYYSIIGGGKSNIASGYNSTIVGGSQNTASERYSFIGGGQLNTASNCYSTISGGRCNNVSGNCSFIGGGLCNTVSGYFSTVGGGQFNTASYSNTTVGGGQCNCASVFRSTVGGGYKNCTSETGAVISGGGRNNASASYSTVGGGQFNTVNNQSATISGGRCNTASGYQSAILGGFCNNTNNYSNSMIIGSNLCATQVCTTFMNCASVENLSVGCFVSVGANKVLQNVPFSPNYGLFAQTTDSIPVTATAVESSLIGVGVGTLSVPANSFSIGDSFDATLDGVISAVGTATLEIRVKTLSGALLTDTGVISMDASTLKSWTLDLQFTIRTLGIAGVASISSGGLFSYIKNSGTNFEGFVLTTLNTTTFDTTIDNTLVVTAQWNTNNAGNSIFSRNFVLHKVY
jgi:hypothetical protein